MGGRGFIYKWFSFQQKGNKRLNKQIDRGGGVTVMPSERCFAGTATWVFVAALDMISHASRQFANDIVQFV